MAILALSLAFIWASAASCVSDRRRLRPRRVRYAIAVVNIGDTRCPSCWLSCWPRFSPRCSATSSLRPPVRRVHGRHHATVCCSVQPRQFDSGAGMEDRQGAARGFNGIPAIPPLTGPATRTRRSRRKACSTCRSPLDRAYALALAHRVSHRPRRRRDQGERAARAAAGYDARAYKLFTFTLGGAIAGWAAACSRTGARSRARPCSAWRNRADHHLGHRRRIGTLVGPVIGCVLIQWLTTQIGTSRPSCQPGAGCDPRRLRAARAARSGAEPGRWAGAADEAAAPLLSHRAAAAGASRRESGMTTPLLETRKLNVRFGGVHATRDVDFTIARPSCVALSPQRRRQEHLLQAAPGQ